MFDYDYEYDTELFAFSEGDIEVYTLPSHSEPCNIELDDIEDAVNTYYKSVGYPNMDTKELINLVRSLYNQKGVVECQLILKQGV